MQRFAEKFFPGVHPATWTDSCGVADLVATCCGGRNFRCAREFVQGKIKGSGETMESVEVGFPRNNFLFSVMNFARRRDFSMVKSFKAQSPPKMCN
jgi:glycerol-3-phosphate dehydrogenase